MSEPVRYGSFTARTECGRCGNPVPLHGPLRRAPCPSCYADVSVADEVWQSVLESFDERHESLAAGEGAAGELVTGAQRLRYEARRGQPACEKCQAPFAVDALGVGSDRDFACVQCGDPAATHPAPDWLRAIVPTARQLYSTEPRSGSPSGLPLEAESAIRPVVMACPACGGSLSATTASERIMSCQYCQSDVYLPDEVWRRLHPVATVREWFVRFEGATRAEIAEREAAAAAAERQRQRAERERAEAERRREQEARAAEERARQEAADAAAIVSMKRAAYVAALLFTLSLLGVFLVNLAAARGQSGLSPDARSSWTIAFGIAAVVLLITSLILANRPIKKATGYDGDWMIFCTWFWVPFAVLMPVVGQIMALIRVIILFRGKFGASAITTNNVSTRSYAAVTLHRGEGRPAALIFLVLTVLYPLAAASVITPEQLARFL